MTIKEAKRFSNRLFDAVLRLLPQLGPETVLPSADHIRLILKSKNTHLLIAETGKEIVGFLTVVTYVVPTGTRFWIEDVIVDESQRGKGIGKELMLYAIDFARAHGAKQIDLTSRPFRTAANDLYKKLGFELRETNSYRYLFV